MNMIIKAKKLHTSFQASGHNDKAIMLELAEAYDEWANRNLDAEAYDANLGFIAEHGILAFFSAHSWDISIG